MSTDDSREYTRRQTLKGGAAAIPLSHSGGDQGFWASLFGSSSESEDTPPAVRVLDAGTEYEGEQLELGSGLSASETSSGVQLDASTSGGLWEEDASGEITPENDGPISVPEANNTKWVRPGDSIQTVVDAASSEYAHAKVKLAGGTTFTESGIDVPGNVTVEAEGGYAGAPTVEPAADEYVFDLNNSAQLRGVRIDTTNITGYSSFAVRFTSASSYDGGVKNLVDCQFVGETAATSGSAAVAMHDADGSGISHVVVKDCFIQGFNHGVLLRAESGGYSNAHTIDVMMRACTQGITLDPIGSGTVVRGNEVTAIMNGSPNTDYAYVIGGDFNHFNVNTFDAGDFNVGAIEFKSGVAENYVFDAVLASPGLIDGPVTDNYVTLPNVGLPNTDTVGEMTGQILSSGTETVTAGGTVVTSPFAQSNTEVDWKYSIDSAASNVKVEARLFYDASNDNYRIEFEEITANADATISYTVYRIN